MGPSGTATPSSGSPTSGSTSRMSSTRRHPATAVWPSFTVSAAISTGSTNRVMRNRNATTAPGLTSPPTPVTTPTTTTSEVATAAKTSPAPENVDDNAPARIAALRWPSMRSSSRSWVRRSMP